MSNQEPQNQEKTAEEPALEKRRRFIKGAGVATPVVLTLSSPSAFGALCLSEIMSGNVSSVGAGSCTLGHTPTWWSNPTNKTAWTTAGFDYGQKNPSNAPENCSNYKNGTKFKSAFGVDPTPGNQNTFMLEIICSTPTTLDAYLVAALLNAKTPNSGYLLTSTQVIGMKTGSPAFSLPSGYIDLLTFLKSTMA